MVPALSVFPTLISCLSISTDYNELMLPTRAVGLMSATGSLSQPEQGIPHTQGGVQSRDTPQILAKDDRVGTDREHRNGKEARAGNDGMLIVMNSPCQAHEEYLQAPLVRYGQNAIVLGSRGPISVTSCQATVGQVDNCWGG